MRRLQCFTLSAFLGLLLSGPCAAQDARATIERAVEAQGGRERLARIGAVSMKWKGVLIDPNPEPFTADVDREWPSRFRNVVHQTLPNGKYTVICVVDGKKVMLQTEYGIQKEREKITEYFEQEMETAAYVDEEVSRLLPLLEDKKFELTSLPEATVLGKPAVGVNVRAKGKPDVKLYFDKQSSLLVKTEYRTIKDVEDHGGEALITYTYDGYREADPAAGDEATLKNAQLPVDGPSLIDYLRKHALGDVDEEDVAVLIRRLGDRSFGVREKATAALIARGQAALPFLQKARKSPDTEVSDRAKRVMRQISATPRNDVLTAVIHLIALRKPAGAAEALLAYLPSAPDANVAAEVRAALAAVAVDNGKPSPIIEKALQDKSPSRRAAAEEVLGKTEPKSRPRQLLLAGVKYPTRVVGYENGKKKSAFAVTEIRFYSSLDPSLFQRP